MEELLYSDNNAKYFLLDYSPSHSEMVIRGVKGSENNIDLFFKAVYNININTKLTGINIYKIKRPDNYSTNNPAMRKNILKVTDNDGLIFFIDAGLFVVFQNKLKLLETSLGQFTWSEQNIEVSALQID